MGPSEAEIARTLARGRLPGTLRAAEGREEISLPHATGADGRPLILSRWGDGLARLRAEGHTRSGPRVELAVTDVPPMPHAPTFGRVRLSGRLRRLTVAEAEAAALEFAEINPVADLLDVGRDASLHKIEVDRVHLGCHHAGRLLDTAEYTDAEPDPLHENESDLLFDLARRHSARLACFFRRALASAGVEHRAEPRAVRIDRYGFVVDVGAPQEDEDAPQWVRVGFAHPLRDHGDVVRLLHSAPPLPRRRPSSQG